MCDHRKPTSPPLNHAATGLHFLDDTALSKARELQPAGRGGVEITSLLGIFPAEGSKSPEPMRRGYAWQGVLSFFLHHSADATECDGKPSLFAYKPDTIHFCFLIGHNLPTMKINIWAN